MPEQLSSKTPNVINRLYTEYSIYTWRVQAFERAIFGWDITKPRVEGVVELSFLVPDGIKMLAYIRNSDGFKATEHIANSEKVGGESTSETYDKENPLATCNVITRFEATSVEPRETIIFTSRPHDGRYLSFESEASISDFHVGFRRGQDN